MNLSETLRTLCLAPGPTGNEREVADVAASLLEKYGPVRIDRLGSVLCSIPGEGSSASAAPVLLEAHLDQVALVVTGIEESGFLSFEGGDVRILASQEVTIYGKQTYYGVITDRPPHLSGGKEDTPSHKALRIDTGLPKETAEAQIPLGSRVLYRTAYAALGEGMVTAPAIDNRAGVTAILAALDRIQGKPHPPVLVQFSVQEESTQAGATAAAFAAFTAGAEEAIAVDVTFGFAPGLTRRETLPLGSGAAIGFSPALDDEFSRYLDYLAESLDLPHTREIMSGRTGTDAERIQAAGDGLRTALLSIPIRNMHTPVETADLKDIEATAKLIAAYLTKGGLV
ncbi:MAG: M20/M25/M40 family metallo-hydrolase [Oscillospiraceae bacterium]|jgi:endoglucanase|nr:M20/M25/M40 family metallo-hydrolase [Oscillospiraceae bacterium]